MRNAYVLELVDLRINRSLIIYLQNESLLLTYLALKTWVDQGDMIKFVNFEKKLKTFVIYFYDIICVCGCYFYYFKRENYQYGE